DPRGTGLARAAGRDAAGAVTPTALESAKAASLPKAVAGHLLMPRAFQRKAHLSAAWSIRLVIGVPAPWPARVSMRIRIGASPACAAWSAAAYLKLCIGTTRSSVSAVVMSVAG